jgi:hypothetical protein
VGRRGGEGRDGDIDHRDTKSTESVSNKRVIWGWHLVGALGFGKSEGGFGKYEAGNGKSALGNGVTQPGDGVTGPGDGATRVGDGVAEWWVRSSEEKRRR